MKRSICKQAEKTSDPTSERCIKKRSKEINVIKEIENEKKSLVANTGNKIKNLTKTVPIKQDPSKCTECLKWEIRLHEQMKIVHLLTAETIDLHKERNALEREKNAWKSLYETCRLI